MWREGGSVWIADLGSANGTKVDGIAVQTVTALQAGDTVVVGTTSLAYQPV